MLARWPGTCRRGACRVRCSRRWTEPDVLEAAGSRAGIMQGVSQLAPGLAARPREITHCGKRHEPTRVHLRTYVDERYK
jgi:hypothetical protein